MISLYDWLYRTYYGVFFDTLDTLGVNLLLVVIGRFLYQAAFKANYGRLGRWMAISDEARHANRCKMTRAEIAWVVGREAAIIVMGMLVQAFALFFLAWSILCVAQFMAGTIPRLRLKFVRGAGYLIRFLFYVLVASAWAVYLMLWILDSSRYGPPGAIAITAGVVVYLLKDRNVTRYTGEELRRYFSARRLAHLSKAGKAAVIAGLIAAPAGFVLFHQYGAAPIVTHSFVTSFDGTLLATDVYRSPFQVGPAPVILMRTPYDKNGIASNIGDYLGEGFVVVLQDTRGKYESGGNESRPFYYDRLDGNATINWIHHQDFYNGKIVTVGGSALGIVQYAVAGTGQAGIVFQSIQVATPELYDHMGFPGGAFRKSLTESWLWGQYQATQYRTPLVDTYNGALGNLYDHPTKDAYWDYLSLASNNAIANVNWPALHYGGWYDIFSQGTITGFVEYQYAGGSGARGHQRMVIGPWTHGGLPDEIHYPLGSPPFSKWEEEMMSASVFGTPIDWDDPCVAYYLMGDLNDSSANYWRTVSRWPLDHVNDTWYFQPDGTLGLAMPSTNKNFTFLYDPFNPVLTWGGNELVDTASVESDILLDSVLDHDHSSTRFEYHEGTGPKNQYASPSPVLGRQDVIEFTTTNLTSAVEVVGQISVNLTVTSNCTDTMFTVKLIDVFPNGPAFNIADGALLMRRRDGPTAPDAFMTAGMNYTITLDLWSIAYRFAVNHCIKVAISSSNFPRFELSPNTNAALNNHPLSGTVNVANNSLSVGAASLSCIYLPRLI